MKSSFASLFSQKIAFQTLRNFILQLIMIRPTFLSLYIVLASLFVTEATRSRRNSRYPSGTSSPVVQAWMEAVNGTQNIFNVPHPVKFCDEKLDRCPSEQPRLEDAPKRLNSLSPYDYCIDRNCSR